MNMLYYARNNLKTFDEEPFNEIDSIIFSWLAYFRLENNKKINPSLLNRCTIRDLFFAEYFNNYVDKINSPADSIELLSLLSCSPRFRNTQVSNYITDLDKDVNKQFAAVTFHLDNGYHYVAFRGTDKSFVGWKEDFYLSFDNYTQSQIQAANYLDSVGNRLKSNIIVGGHSKGGNLAVFAAAMCKKTIQNKIIKVFSHDGPGFSSDTLKLPGFMAIKDRITKTIPQSALVGLFFEQECDCQIIESNGIGIFQHSPFNWQIEDNHFIKRDRLSTDGNLVYHKVYNWINKMNQEDRKRITHIIFDSLENTGAEDFKDFSENLQKYIPIFVKEISNLDKKDQKFILNLVYLLITSNSRNKVTEIINEDLTMKKGS